MRYFCIGDMNHIMIDIEIQLKKERIFLTYGMQCKTNITAFLDIL